MDLSGNMTRQVEQDMAVENDDSHIVNIGRLVEDMELKMRNLLRMYYKFCIGLLHLLTAIRGGVLRKSKRCRGRPKKYFLSFFHRNVGH